MKFAPLVIIAILAGVIGYLVGTRGSTAAQATPAAPLSASAVYARAREAVMTVRSSQADLSGFDAKGIGTAFHIGGGYWVTAAHVVSDGYQFYLDDSARTVTRLADNSGLRKVEVVGKDSVSDIAVLKAEAAPATLSWAARDAEVGDAAYAVGNPFAIAPNSFSGGIVSGLNRAIGTERGTLAGMLQMDTPVNPGNSGGPLLNVNGDVIGVVSANFAPVGQNGNQSAGVGFAVPMSAAKTIAEALKNSGKYVHPSLGVIGADSAQPQIQALQPGGNAARAGLREQDTVLKIGDLEVESFEELNAIIAAQLVGAKVKLLVKRGTGTLGVTVELSAP